MPEELVISNNVILLRTCDLYRTHHSAVLEYHHICPKSWFARAGVPVETPMIFLCANCHNDTHAAIDGLIKGQLVYDLPPRCVKLAHRALALAELNHLTPEPTL
jgi:hypothetical protein